MRQIVIFVDSSQFGGIETHIIELATLLKANKLDAYVLFYQHHDNQQLFDALDGVGCAYHFLDAKPWSLYHCLRKLDNVIVHTHGYKAGIIGRITCKLLSYPCVSTYHAGESGKGKIRLYNWLDHLTSGLSQNIVVNQQLLKKVKNGQFMANFMVPRASKKTIKHNSTHIAFVGRLSHEKAPDRFIKLAHSFEHQPELEFHIYGSGEMEDNLRDTAPSNVTLHGHQTTSSFWKNIDILVLCSREEGLPMVLLEAIDNNVLCICHPVGAVDSVIVHEHSGLLTAHQTNQELAIQLTSLLSRTVQSKTQLTIQAKQRLTTLFSGQQQIKVLREIYEQ